MTVYCKTEDAREFVALVHDDGLEIPRNVSFKFINNHFMAAVLFAAMGEPGQRHNLGHLFVSFRAIRPKDGDMRKDKAAIRSEASDNFEASEAGARKRMASNREMTIIDALDFEIANTWGMDDGPVKIYAVNSIGEVALVSHMGGFMKQTNPNWHNIEESIQNGIRREFTPCVLE